MSEQQSLVRSPHLFRALANGLRDAYDHLGFVVVVSFISFAVSTGLVAAGLRVIAITRPGMYLGALVLLPGVLFYYFSLLTASYYAHRCTSHEHPCIAEAWRGVQNLFVPALKLFVLDAAIMIILLGDAVFFLSMKQFWGTVFLSTACLYFAGCWVVLAAYHVPLLPAQLEMPSGPRTLVIVRKSFLLAIGRPGFTVGLVLVIIGLAVLCVLPALIGAATFLTGASAFILTHALRELFISYGVVEEQPETIEDTDWPRN